MQNANGARADMHDDRPDPLFQRSVDPMPIADDDRPHPLFQRSLNPMLIADDDRRFVDANAAARLFHRRQPHEICSLTVDDLTRPDLRPGLDAAWQDFLRGGGSRRGGRTVPWDLQMPDGTSYAVDLSSIPHFRPGRHLVIILVSAARKLNEQLAGAKTPLDTTLTKREREILTLVALGNTGVQIARQLFLSPATVATHVSNALIKLGAKNRAHGIAIALLSGQLDLADQTEDRLPSTDRRAPWPSALGALS